MKLLCALFGHRPEDGYYRDYGGGSSKYLTVEPCGIDGIRREHANLKTECRRCGKMFIVGKIHLPQREAEKDVVAENARLKKLMKVGEGI